LVTLNYRLGAFGNQCNSEESDSVSSSMICICLLKLDVIYMQTGFLSTEDTEAPGNYGLLDQSLALRYVKYV
jgi:carboxylesterase type B